MLYTDALKTDKEVDFAEIIQQTEKSENSWENIVVYTQPKHRQYVKFIVYYDQCQPENQKLYNFNIIYVGAQYQALLIVIGNDGITVIC